MVTTRSFPVTLPSLNSHGGVGLQIHSRVRTLNHGANNLNWEFGMVTLLAGLALCSIPAMGADSNRMTTKLEGAQPCGISNLFGPQEGLCDACL